MSSPYAVPAIRIGSDVRTHVTTVAAVTAISAGNDHLGGRHAARPWRAYGPVLRYVRAARPGRVGPVPGRARPLPHVPGRGVAAPRWRGTAAFCRRRVRRVPAVWMARRSIRALPLHGLSRGAAGGLLVQGPRVLSVLWRTSHDRARGAPRGSGLAGGARATVGAHSVATRPLRLGVAPRLVHGGGWRAVPRGSAPPRTWAQTRRLGDARSGAIIVVQRFGGALNLNVYLHALVLDGVFERAGDGQLRFHRAPAPSAADVAERSRRRCGRGSRGRACTMMTGGWPVP